MSVIRTVFALFVAWLLIYLTHGAIEWAIRSKASHIFARLQYDTDKIVQRLDLGVVVFIGVIALASILVIWRIFENPKEALQSVFAFGFTLGTQRISVGLILAAIGILYGAFFISWALQKLLTEQVLARRQADPGVRFSIARLVHYVVIFIGFLFALAALGLELTKITIIFGALGVGIGFGLQTIVNNFASGIIMLFERPVKVGDYIELNGQWAEVKKIGLRATVVQTFERSDIVVPNSDLISNQVINWTLSSRIVRLIIPVGVAYGSDIPLVLETLKACATSNPKLMKNPEPQVLFKNFGASSLDFELRIWIWNVDDRQIMNSELHQEIDRRFREANIEIAFPQSDLHLRSVEESVHLIQTQASTDAVRPDPSVIAPKDGDDEGH
jgi:small-conductance mechanosensitive channel